VNEQDLLTMMDYAYANEVKRRLSSDEEWAEMLTPVLRERTYGALVHMIESINRQRREHIRTASADWFKRVNGLRKLAVTRLLHLEKVTGRVSWYEASATHEGKLWREFSAKLAQIVLEFNPTLLEGVYAPRGGVDALDWIVARNAKREREETAS